MVWRSGGGVPVECGRGVAAGEGELVRLWPETQEAYTRIQGYKRASL